MQDVSTKRRLQSQQKKKQLRVVITFHTYSTATSYKKIKNQFTAIFRQLSATSPRPRGGN